METKCVGDKFEMLVTDSGWWWPIKYIKEIFNITEKVVNIMIPPPTSQISHHHNDVINITVWVITKHTVWVIIDATTRSYLKAYKIVESREVSQRGLFH